MNDSSGTGVWPVDQCYNRNSSRLYKDNTLTTGLDELYSYDGLDRLISMDRGTLNAAKTAVTGGTFDQDWSLDALGNWSKFTQDADGSGTGASPVVQTRLHNAANEIVQIDGQDGSALGGLLTPASGWVDPKHDANGNVTVMPNPASPTQTRLNVYDAWNRLVKVADNAANVVATYEYAGSTAMGCKITPMKSGMGWRIEETVEGSPDVTNSYYYTANWQAIEERKDGDSDPYVQNVFGTRYIDEIIQRQQDSNTDGAVDETHYVLQDANFNVTAIVDATGMVVERYSYTPYGQRAVLDANWATDTDGLSDVLLSSGHQGLIHDDTTGLVYNRNRWVHVGLGRFMSRDPLIYIDGANLFQYLSSNPIMQLDPYGTCGTAGAANPAACAEVMAILSGIAGRAVPRIAIGVGTATLTKSSSASCSCVCLKKGTGPDAIGQQPGIATCLTVCVATGYTGARCGGTTVWN